jgi:hypothetical protein
MFKHVRFIEVEDEYTKLSFVQKDEEVKVIRFDKPIAVLISQDETKIDELISLQDERILCEVITINEFKALVETTAQYSRVLELSAERLEKNMEVIKRKYPESERATWPKQLSEAIKWLETKNDDDAPYLKIVSDRENDTVENFVNAVLAKNAAYTAFSANANSDKRLYQAELLSEWGI